MKKILSLVVLLAILATTAASAAEIDLSGMTFDELRALQDQLTAEMVKRPECKQTVLPAGRWEAGVDLPCGKYIIQKFGPEYNLVVETYGNGSVWNEGGYGLLEEYILLDDKSTAMINLVPGITLEISSPANINVFQGFSF